MIPIVALAAALLDLTPFLGGAEGAIVALDPRDGQILGLASRASALGEAWPIGSLVKPVTAAAALSAGIDRRAPQWCPGGTGPDGKKACWLPAGHGWVDLERALAVSCNHAFAALARRVGTPAILAAARAFGLGALTGVDLGGESAGALDPSGPPEEVGTGLGPQIRATPLAVATLAASLATGRRVTPRTFPSRPGPLLPLAGILEPVRRGMTLAARAGGTAALLEDHGIDAAGKTGTARHDGGFRTHGWFMGWAPAREPAVALAVFLREGEGRRDAVPIAARVFEWLLAPERRSNASGAGFASASSLSRPTPHAGPESRSPHGVDDDLSTPEEGHPEHLKRAHSGTRAVTVRLFSRGGVREAVVNGRGLWAAGHSVRARGAPLAGRVHIPPSGVGPVEVRVAGMAPRRFHGALEVRASGGELVLVAHLALEDYVAGVVDAEMPFDEPAALRAQAIVSRTFSARERGRHREADFCDLTHCQLWRGAARQARAVAAAEETRGIVLAHRGALARAYYHADSGGMTAEPPPAFGAAPYLAAVDDSAFLAGSPHLGWRALVPDAVMERALGAPVSRARVEARDLSGRATRVVLSGPGWQRELSGYELYIALGRAGGWHRVKSARFDVRRGPGGFFFDGSGLGHGVGLAQYGARGMARAGRDHAAILRAYFPGAELRSLDAVEEAW